MVHCNFVWLTTYALARAVLISEANYDFAFLTHFSAFRCPSPSSLTNFLSRTPAIRNQGFACPLFITHLRHNKSRLTLHTWSLQVSTHSHR